MKFNQLVCFVEVANKRSINKAAQALYISQPNISRTIASLEEELGKKLFNRHNHGITLTSDGEYIYNYAVSIVSQVDVISSFKRVDNPNLCKTLSVVAAHIVLDDDLMVKYYHQTNSKNVKINILETGIETAINRVYNLDSEVALVIVNEKQFPIFNKILELKGLEAEEVDRGKIHIHLKKDHPLVKKKSITFADLFEYPLVELPQDYFSYLSYGYAINDTCFVDAFNSIVMNNYHAIINLVKNSDAFTFGGKWNERELNRIGIVTKEIEDCDEVNHLILFKRKKEILSDDALWFIKEIKKIYLGTHM